MNKYSMLFNWKNETYFFYIYTYETEEYVWQVIIDNQREYHFPDVCELLDYICDTYEMTWGYLYFDMTFADSDFK